MVHLGGYRDDETGEFREVVSPQEIPAERTTLHKEIVDAG